MFSTRIRDSPFKKRLSTLERGSRGNVRCPEMAILENSEFAVEFSPIHLVKFAEACNSKGMPLKNRMK